MEQQFLLPWRDVPAACRQPVFLHQQRSDFASISASEVSDHPAEDPAGPTSVCPEATPADHSAAAAEQRTEAEHVWVEVIHFIQIRIFRLVALFILQKVTQK